MLSLCQPPGLLQVLGCLSHALFHVLLGLKHVLFKVISLKCSIRLNNEAFNIGILRRRQELGRILNFKCLYRPPRAVDVVSCVGLDYLLEKLRRSL